MRHHKTKPKTVHLLPPALHPDVLAAMIDALPDAVLAGDLAEGTIIYANHNAQALLGLGAKNLMGLAPAEIFGAENPALDALKSARATGQAATLHDISIRGREIAACSCIPMPQQGLCLFVLRYNLVPLKNEWMARMKQALKPAQHIARVMAHEIKNPLSGIRGAAQLLAASPLGAEDRELAQLIDAETQRIFRLIDKVNIFDDAARHLHEPVNIHEILTHVEKIARSGFAAHVGIIKKYDPSLPDILGQRDHLVQALLNLVKNAAEAAPATGGRILLQTRYDTAAGFHPESHMRLPVCIEIEDNGPGISGDIRERLFEPYQTTKPQGEGLGLSIVSKIADDHGGAVDITSQPGKTVFKLSFPMPKRNEK